jgi:hypothetical protein
MPHGFAHEWLKSMKPTLLFSMLRAAIPALALLLALPGDAQTKNPAEYDLYIEVLRATRYFDTLRASLSATCAKINAESSFCAGFVKKLKLTPNTTLEDIALPHLKSHMTPEEAKETVEFWSTPASKVALTKMIAAMSNGSTYLPENNEIIAIQQFTNSPPGIALKRFQTDVALARAINIAIGNDVNPKHGT